MEYLSKELQEYFESLPDTSIQDSRQEAELLRKEKRFTIYSPDQCTMIDFNPAKLFPNGCFERFLVNTIKGMDISDFSLTYLHDRGGKTEYNPRCIRKCVKVKAQRWNRI